MSDYRAPEVSISPEVGAGMEVGVIVGMEVGVIVGIAIIL